MSINLGKYFSSIKQSALWFVFCTYGTDRLVDFSLDLVRFHSSLSAKKELKNHGTLITHRLQKWHWCWHKGNVVHTTYVLYLKLINLNKPTGIHTCTHTQMPAAANSNKNCFCVQFHFSVQLEGWRPRHHWRLSVTETYPPGIIITQTQPFSKGY